MTFSQSIFFIFLTAVPFKEEIIVGSPASCYMLCARKHLIASSFSQAVDGLRRFVSLSCLPVGRRRRRSGGCPCMIISERSEWGRARQSELSGSLVCNIISTSVWASIFSDVMRWEFFSLFFCGGCLMWKRAQVWLVTGFICKGAFFESLSSTPPPRPSRLRCCPSFLRLFTCLSFSPFFFSLTPSNAPSATASERSLHCTRCANHELRWLNTLQMHAVHLQMHAVHLQWDIRDFSWITVYSAHVYL